MRYLFDAAVSAFTSSASLPADPHHSDFSVHNKTYIQWLVARELPQLHLPPNGLIFLQTGSWDLRVRTAEHFLRDFSLFVLPILIKHKSRVVWLSTPPIPCTFSPLMEAGNYYRDNVFTNLGVSRNNFVIHTVEAFIAHHLHVHGIRSVSVFTLSYPWYEQSACDIHYICREERQAPVISFPGHLVLEKVVHQACIYHQAQ